MLSFLTCRFLPLAAAQPVLMQHLTHPKNPLTRPQDNRLLHTTILANAYYHPETGEEIQDRKTIL